MPFILSLLIIALTLGAVVDIIQRDQAQVKFLPKMAWIIIVILLMPIGGLLWFTLGRDYGDSGVRLPRIPRAERARPATQPYVPPPSDVRTTEQQIADLDREIEEWRLRDELEKRKREDGEIA